MLVGIRFWGIGFFVLYSCRIGEGLFFLVSYRVIVLSFEC